MASRPPSDQVQRRRTASEGAEHLRVSPPAPSPIARYRRGLLTSIRGNFAAFGYSVMITSGYGILNGNLGSPSVGQTLLFALGATLAFIVIGRSPLGVFGASAGSPATSWRSGAR